MEKIVLGLSGGVDSAVALSLLQQQGFDVHGVFLDIGCGGTEDAAAVAARAGASFEVVDIRTPLETHVCTPFAAGYLAGETPSPCAICNPTVKFPSLFAAADRIGAHQVATGHYARILQRNGESCLAAATSDKDQSYMLARLEKQWLPRLQFPLGALDKEQVRALAHQFAIPVADKPDSMEICFIPDDDYGAWLEQRQFSTPEGNFVDKSGNILGRHKGIHRYTIGQGRGLGVSHAHRLFVSEIRPETNEVVLSDGSDLYTTRIFATHYNELYQPDGPITAKFRHSKTRVAATMTRTGDNVIIETAEPVRAPTPGQLAVLYNEEIVLGSAWIGKEALG